jgi:hypothetical protein
VACQAVAMSEPASIVKHSSEDALAAQTSIGITDTSYAGSSEFDLPCPKERNHVPTGEPWEDAQEGACTKRAKKAPGCRRQAVTFNMAQFAANAQQKEAFIDGLVKAMSTSGIPLTFLHEDAEQLLEGGCCCPWH